MKIQKKMLAGLIAVMMIFTFVACGQEKKEPSEVQSDNITDEETEIDDLEEDSLEEDDLDEVEPDESKEPSTEFEIPVQENFTLVEGLSDKYVDFDNRAFAYNGKVFKLGESTLKDLIDGGIPFDESELNNKGNNVNSNYETGRYTVEINGYVFMQFRFINVTNEPKTEEECLLSYVRYYYIHLPQPNYDAEENKEATESILDAAKTVCFSFPATLTKEQLLENSSEGAEADEYNNVDYNIDSEVYLGGSGYHFEFDRTTNQLDDMHIDWLP